MKYICIARHVKAVHLAGVCRHLWRISFSLLLVLLSFVPPLCPFYPPLMIYPILVFHNCFVYLHTHTQTCAKASKQHFSWLPLSFVTFLGASVARHWISFILFLIVFCLRIIAERFAGGGEQQRQWTQWTSERHLVSFVSLDLFAVSVIDFCLYREGNKWTKNRSLHLFIYFFLS